VVNLIKTKNIHHPKDNLDGLRVLITRFYPRGIKKTHFDIWIRELAPSKQLLNEYKNNKKTWKEFVKIFKTELERNKESLQVINDLKIKSKSKNVTLLCFEKEGTPCHRHLLKKIIQNPKYLKIDFEANLED
jgi:uncharacterized protein YeaO (DUF488 family)